jgi:hypothetical protein
MALVAFDLAHLWPPLEVSATAIHECPSCEKPRSGWVAKDVGFVVGSVCEHCGHVEPDETGEGAGSPGVEHGTSEKGELEEVMLQELERKRVIDAICEAAKRVAVPDILGEWDRTVLACEEYDRDFDSNTTTKEERARIVAVWNETVEQANREFGYGPPPGWG